MLLPEYHYDKCIRGINYILIVYKLVVLIIYVQEQNRQVSRKGYKVHVQSR